MSLISDRQKLQQVEDKIEALKARHLELLEKATLTKREEFEMREFEKELAELKAKEKFWQGIIDKSIL
jgi:hypothetical protein